MDKVGRSWRLLAATLKLVRKNPALLFFPLCSTVIFFSLAAVSALLGAHYLDIHFSLGFMQEFKGKLGALFLPACLAVGAVYTPIGIFLNAALVGCALLQLEDKPHGLRDGLRLAWGRRKAVLQWTLMSVTIGVVIGLLESKLDRIPCLGAVIAKWLLRVVGFGWGLATFLIVPVIVFEDQPTIRARLRRSGELARRSWGEQVAGRAGVGTVTVLVIWAVILITAGVAVALSYAYYWPLWKCMRVIPFVVVALVFSLSPLFAAANGIYTAVLYGYAVTGMLPQEFSPDLLPQRRKE